MGLRPIQVDEDRRDGDDMRPDAANRAPTVREGTVLQRSCTQSCDGRRAPGHRETRPKMFEVWMSEHICTHAEGLRHSGITHSY